MIGRIIRGGGKRAVRLARSSLYHQTHRHAALKILETVKKKDNLNLPDDQRRVCDEYALEAFGSKKYAPWLYVYTAMTGEFREGWIPDNYYGEVIVPQLNGTYGKTSAMKPLNRALFRSDAFPDIASYVNGIVFTRDYHPVAPDLVKEMLFSEHERIVFKADSSLQGKGIFFFTRESFNIEEINKIGNGLFQKAIDQHESLRTFCDTATATLRLTTVFDRQQGGGGGFTTSGTFAPWTKRGNTCEDRIANKDPHQ